MDDDKKPPVKKYRIGDLVRLRDRTWVGQYFALGPVPDPDDNAERLALVIEESTSWITALEDTNGTVYNVWDIGTRYWDDVNFCPYRVQTLSGKVLWASVNDMELVSPANSAKDGNDTNDDND